MQSSTIKTFTILSAIVLLLTMKLSCLYTSPLPKGIKSIEQIERQKDDTVKFRNYLRLADTLSFHNDDSAGMYFRKADKLVRALKYKKGLLQLNYQYRKWHLRNGDLQSMLKLDKESLEISKSLNDNDLIGAIYTNLGMDHAMMGNFEDAAKSLLDAMKLLERVPDHPYLQSNFNNLANVFMELKNPMKALYYAQKGYDLSMKNKSLKHIASAVLTLGNAYAENKDFTKAKEYFNEVLVYADSLKSSNYYKAGMENEFRAYINLGEIAIKQGEYSKALTNLDKARTTLKAVPFADFEIALWMNMAEANYKLKLYKKANENVLKAISLGQQLQAPNELRLIYKLGSEVNEHLNLANALDYRKKYEVLNDSILNTEKQQNVERLEIEYQTTKKEKEIVQQQLSLAKKEVELKNKNYVITLAIFIMVFLLFAVVVILIVYRNKQKVIMEKLRYLEKDRELQVLEAMMNGEEKERSRLAKDLHDGVGGLLSATKMHLSILRNEQTVSPNIEKFEHTMSIIDSATKEIRTIAHNLAPEILSNNGLDIALETFCESVSSETLPIQYCSIGLIPRLKVNVELIVYRIAQELVNNALKHSQATEVFVQLSHHNDFMTLSVEDNGVGMTEAEQKGIGIINLQSRVETLNGELSISSQPNKGTSIYVEFDITSFKVFYSTESIKAIAS